MWFRRPWVQFPSFAPYSIVMKYHYQQGIVEKDKKGHKKLWVAFLGVTAMTTYSGFVFASLALNGYPLEPIDTTAKLVKSSKPGSFGNHLFIPAINLSSDINSSLLQSGAPEKSDVTLKGSQLAFGVTPDGLRASSPFFNIDKLKEGDEVFLDNNKTRYVYKIDRLPRDNEKKLTLQSKDKKLIAVAVGTIAWSSGKAELQPL